MDFKKKKPSRVQGAWGGGGSGKTCIGISNKDSSKRCVDSKTNCVTVSTNANIDSHKFVFQQPSERDMMQKPPEVINIHEEGVHEISLGPTGPSRLRFFPQIFDRKEADWMLDDLLKNIPWQQLINRLPGQEAYAEPRLIAWFGDIPYRYSGVQANPNPWTPLLTMLKDRIKELTGYSFNSCLANYYRNDKDSVGWHSDDEPLLGKEPLIGSLSFGATRVFELRKKPEPPIDRDDFRLSQLIKVPLCHGSLLFMEGATQEDWQHRIPKEYHDRGPRVNLTFRTVHPQLDDPSWKPAF